MYIYMFIHTCIYIHVYIYIYTYIAHIYKNIFNTNFDVYAYMHIVVLARLQRCNRAHHFELSHKNAYAACVYLYMHRLHMCTCKQ